MKAYLQKLIGTAVLGLALSLNSIPAWAGYVSVFPVTITNKAASGSLTGARYSADSRQSIGCSAYGFLLGDGLPYVLCSAQDETGKFLGCSSRDPRFADAVNAMTDSSHIYFTTSGTGLCDELTVINDSVYLR